MRRKLTSIRSIVPLSAICMCMCPLSWPQQRVVSLDLADVKGIKHSISEYRGRVVVLNFWATWCVPCQDEMPLLVATQKHYSGRGLVVLGASLDELQNAKLVDAVIKKYKINFPIFLNVSEEDMADLGLESVPATVLLDRGGRAVGLMQGKLNEADLNRKINSALHAEH